MRGGPWHRISSGRAISVSTFIAAGLLLQGESENFTPLKFFCTIFFKD